LETVKSTTLGSLPPLPSLARWHLPFQNTPKSHNGRWFEFHSLANNFESARPFLDSSGRRAHRHTEYPGSTGLTDDPLFSVSWLFGPMKEPMRSTSPIVALAWKRSERQSRSFLYS